MKYFLILILSFYMSQSSYTQDYEEIKKLAKQGDSEKQYDLGWGYMNGFVTSSREPKKGFYWISKAANQENVNAEYYLGYMYNYGFGIDQDLKKSFYWFAKAARQENVDKGKRYNHKEAQYNLATMYLWGKGTTVDYEKALYWFTKLAEQRHEKSQYFLGMMYYVGAGTTVDHKKAGELFIKAAKSNHSDAQFMIGQMIYHKEYEIQGYAKTVNGEIDYIIPNKEVAARWIKKAVNSHHKEAKEFWNKYELWEYLK